MIRHLILTWDTMMPKLVIMQVYFVQNVSLGKILLQTSNNVSCQLTRHFIQKMNDLFNGFEFIRAYMDDLLVLTK